MKNIFKLSNKRRSHAEIWVVLFLILVLVGYYYMLYIPSQQNRLVEQKFRSLSRIDENIHNKIESYQKYIRSYVFDSDLWNSQKIREKIEGGNYYDEDKKILIKRRTDNSKIIPQDSAKTILDIQNNQLEQIVYTCSENGALEFSQRNNFKEFIRPLLTNDLFDNYLILSDSGVLFESFPSGMSFKKLDSVFDSRSTIHYCKLRDIEIGGVSYKMFLQPLGNLSGSEIVIVGLLTTGNFNANVRQLPEALITPILYILLSILLLFPLLKLMLMGKAERMRFVDLLFSYISLMMLCGTTILILCRYSPQVDNETNKHLETISNQIESNFNTEVHSAFRHLSNLDSIVNDTKNGLTTQKKSFAEQQWGLVSINDKDKINFDKKKNTDKNNSTEKTDKTENQNQFLQNVFNSIKDNYIRISQVYWIDPNAKIRINWTEAATNPPFGMVDDRKYFSAIKEQQFYYLDNDITQPYYLQPVISWSDKQYKLVISKPSIHKDFAATGMSCYFNSLIRTTLPPGISFALLDEGGEVLAHSDSLKNLRENMYNESDAASVISGIQLTEVPRHFNTKYSGGNYSAYAKKIKGLPYVLVVFEDRSYESSRYVSALFYALILFGSLLVVMLGEILLLSFNGYNRSVLKKNDFNFNWIFPRTGQRQKYWMITATNGLLIIILPLYFTHVLNGNVELILKSLITTFLLSTLFYTLVSCEKNKLKFEFNRKKGLLFWSFMLILFFMLFHSAIQPCTSRALLRTLGPAGITLGICILNFSLLKNGITYRGNSLLPDAGSARRSYSAVVFSRILLTCGMPVMYFYCSGYNLILRNEAKEKLFVFAQQVNRYNKSNLDPVLYPANCSMPIHQFLGIYFDQFWISDTCRYESKPGTDEFRVDMEQLQLHTMRKAMAISKTRKHPWFYSYGQRADTGSYSFVETKNGIMLNMRPTFNSICDTPGSQSIFYTGKDLFASMSLFGTNSNKLNEVILIVVLIVLLLILFFLIGYTTEKIFGKYSVPEMPSRFLRNQILETEMRKLLFIQGPPGSGKTQFVREYLRYRTKEKITDQHGTVQEVTVTKKYQFAKSEKDINETTNAVIIDLLEIPDSSESDNIPLWRYKITKILENKNLQCILINHFEYNIRDLTTNRIKLNFLEKLLIDHGQRKLVIVSTIDLGEFIYSMENNLVLDESQRAEIFEDVHRWRVLLGNFANIYLPLDTHFEHAAINLDSPIEDVLKNECGSIKFLQPFREEMEKTIQLQRVRKEEPISAIELIFQIQGFATHFYQYLWASLTREEQIILIDMAEDGILNTSNAGCLKLLIDKGIISMVDGKMQLFNLSFRNFLLTVITTEDKQKLVTGIDDNSYWNNYKYPIGIVAASLVWLLLYSDPEKFGNILPTLTALGTGVPIIFRLLTMFKTGEVK